MKLSSGTFLSDRVPALVAELLGRVGAKELDTYTIWGDTDADSPRFLVATDRGLADIGVKYAERGRVVDLTCLILPWHRVSADVTVSVKAGMGDKEEGGKVVLTDGGPSIDRRAAEVQTRLRSGGWPSI